GPEEAVHLWSRRWFQAQLDLSDQQADRDAALASYQERLKKTDEIARARLVLGNSPVFGLKMAPDKTPRDNYQAIWHPRLAQDNLGGLCCPTEALDSTQLANSRLCRDSTGSERKHTSRSVVTAILETASVTSEPWVWKAYQETKTSEEKVCLASI